MWSGFGYQAEEKRINSAKAAAYVTKYASKQSPSAPKGFRRVRASQGWTKLPEKGQDALIVQAVGESLQNYLSRVADETDIPMDVIVSTWLEKETAFDYWDKTEPPKVDRLTKQADNETTVSYRET